jgi:hypothetical protein
VWGKPPTPPPYQAERIGERCSDNFCFAALTRQAGKRGQRASQQLARRSTRLRLTLVGRSYERCCATYRIPSRTSVPEAWQNNTMSILPPSYRHHTKYRCHYDARYGHFVVGLKGITDLGIKNERCKAQGAAGLFCDLPHVTCDVSLEK